MIYEEIQGYLTRAASPEEVVQFDAAYAVLKDFEVDDCLMLFDTMIGEASAYGDVEMVDSLKSLMTNALRSLMALHSIMVHDDEGLMRPLTAFGQVLLLLPDWEQKEDILNLLTGEEQDCAESQFASICALVLGQPSENFLIHLSSVSPALIDNIKEQMKPKEEIIMPEYEALIRQYLTEYERMRSRVKSPTLWADFALASPVAFGLPFELHFKRFLTERAQEIAQTQTPEQFKLLAEELIAIATISEEKIGRAVELVRRYQFDICPDVAQSAQLDHALMTIYPEISRATP